MTRHRHPTSATLEEWLEAGSTGAPDYVLTAVLDRLATTPQQRIIRFGALSLATSSAMWASAAAAVMLVVAALFVGGALPDRLPIGAPPSAPSTASPVVGIDPPATSGLLAAGRYEVPEPFPSGITFEVEAGWSACQDSEYEWGVCRRLGRSGVAISFLIVEDLVANPCTGERRAVPVGPGLDDLADALVELPGFLASDVEARMLDGHDAREVTVTATSQCSNLQTWITPSRTNGVAAGEGNLMVMVDVDGVRVVIAGAYQPGAGGLSADAQRALIEQVIESVRIAG